MLCYLPKAFEVKFVLKTNFFEENSKFHLKTHLVQLEVEPTGVTNRVAVGVASPQGGRSSVAVDALHARSFAGGRLKRFLRKIKFFVKKKPNFVCCTAFFDARNAASTDDDAEILAAIFGTVEDEEELLYDVRCCCKVDKFCCCRPIKLLHSGLS